MVTDVYGRDSVCADVAYGMSQDGSELTVMDYNTYEPSDHSDVLQAAAVVTDVYGRDSVCADVAYGMSQDGSELTVMDYNTYEPSDHWTYG